MIVIIDYNIGNPASIKNMLKKIGAKSVISKNKDEILSASKLILPGVGSFDSGMQHLEEYGLIDILNEKVLNQNTPILGICLGMQLMTKQSEEGEKKGLAWIDAQTLKFKDNEKIKIPHMGWNIINVRKEKSILSNSQYDFQKFYFVHSFFVKCNDKNIILATTNYGHEFCSAFQKDNIYGLQFHPEKSHKYGMEILKKYVEL